MGYAVIYGFMNLGAFFSGVISSSTRPYFEDVFTPNGLTGVFWIYVVLTIFALMFSVILITKAADKAAYKKVSGSDEEETTDENKEKLNNIPAIIWGLLFLIALVLYFYAP